jgi:hypothetical protein
VGISGYQVPSSSFRVASGSEVKLGERLLKDVCIYTRRSLPILMDSRFASEYTLVRNVDIPTATNIINMVFHVQPCPPMAIYAGTKQNISIWQS